MASTILSNEGCNSRIFTYLLVYGGSGLFDIHATIAFFSTRTKFFGRKINLKHSEANKNN
jgi:hypothetical protein